MRKKGFHVKSFLDVNLTSTQTNPYFLHVDVLQENIITIK